MNHFWATSELREDIATEPAGRLACEDNKAHHASEREPGQPHWDSQ